MSCPRGYAVPDEPLPVTFFPLMAPCDGSGDVEERDEVLDPAVTMAHRDELRKGRRFGFGQNWSHFAPRIDASAIAEAEQSVLELLRPTGRVQGGRLDGVRFLDAGCGSGLFSLAALRLGAIVTAFDYDPDSVLTTRRLVDAQASPEEAARLTLLHGSVLDREFLEGLGAFDVVYSWGVLHHTGAMWEACRSIATNVARDGALVVALYHDAGRASEIWWRIKRMSAALPRLLQVPLAAVVLVPIEGYALLRSLARRDPRSYVRRWTQYRSLRGMSRWHDHLDWVGGFPYEWASREAVVNFFEAEGFAHLMTVDATAWGCNEFTFRRD